MSLCLQGGMVWSFVIVLVDVFDRLDGGTDFHIYVTLELHQQLSAVRNDIGVEEGHKYSG
ncbi:hypothetical protein PAXRUDRAFT_22407 [Paxillus rubicundulus Ve08.2h10]|uniref:Uncharacterized protein n=1 Tax=Paxillus rubicundulus Ve08.2h10 TaxID=930991 RepID=A0A0D0D5G2_9AGAM|nr:hypothetical protein PAXRUDRAFT_22407 [Paxillus rubicundulus Ve08.2h10]